MCYSNLIMLNDKHIESNFRCYDFTISFLSTTFTGLYFAITKNQHRETIIVSHCLILLKSLMICIDFVWVDDWCFVQFIIPGSNPYKPCRRHTDHLRPLTPAINILSFVSFYCRHYRDAIAVVHHLAFHLHWPISKTTTKNRVELVMWLNFSRSLLFISYIFEYNHETTKITIVIFQEATIL